MWWIWVIVAVVVIAVIAALLAVGRNSKRTRDRSRAESMREEAAVRAPELRQREAHARETEAEAAAARAEADRRQAEAERLEAQAEDRHRHAGELREEHEEHLRRADELDPDVDTKRDDYVPGAGGAQEPTAAGTHEEAAGEPVGGRGGSTGPTTVTTPEGETEAVDENARLRGSEQRGEGGATSTGR
jgi:hypothetical protein